MQKKGSLNETEKELDKIKTVLSKSSKLATFLNDPLHKKEEKQKFVVSLLKEQNYSTHIINFFQIVAENGRLGLTSKIIQNFGSIMRAYRNEVPINIISATGLSGEQVDTIVQSIKTNFLKAHEVPKISTTIDQKLLGGMIVEVGDKTIDMSAASSLNSINASLQETIYQ